MEDLVKGRLAPREHRDVDGRSGRRSLGGRRVAFCLFAALSVLGCDQGPLGEVEMGLAAAAHDAGVEHADAVWWPESSDDEGVADLGVETTDIGGQVDADADAADADAPDADAPDLGIDAEVPEGPPPAPVVETRPFRALHWNIAGGKENRCQPALITRAVLRYVENAGGPVDFVALNEVCRPQYLAIRDALRRHWNKGEAARFAAFHANNADRGVGLALFSRRNIEQITRDRLGSDRYGDRFLLCARQVGRRLRLCAVHLTPGDPAARRQLARVLDRIEGWWHQQRDTVVIGGDFNITPDDVAFDAMYAAGANSRANPGNQGRYRELDDADPNNCPGYGERTLLGTTTGPCRAGRKIDFIFVRANRIVDGDYSADALGIPNDCTGACSDHRAVRGRAHIRFRVD